MLETEERLFDEYKNVDNFCRDSYSSQNGINQYITEMEQNSFRGRSIVPLWDEDYRMLKHIRWLRNQIAHETSATDCNEEDAAWLEEFHRRLLERRDPLAVLKKADRERSNFSSRREDVSFIQLSSINEVQLSSPSQRKSVSETGSEQTAYKNARLRRKKASPLKRAIVAIIVLVEVLVILYIVALLLTAMTRV